MFTEVIFLAFPLSHFSEKISMEGMRGWVLGVGGAKGAEGMSVINFLKAVIEM
jgi:hypothetical protein